MSSINLFYFLILGYYIMTIGRGIRLAGAGKKKVMERVKRSPNKWIQHVMKVWKSTPGITYKQAISLARSSYRK